MSLFLQTCLGKSSSIPPIWMMRQAGRYLPEYREIRKKYSDFMRFCFSVKSVEDVTLQPIDRFDFDAAIIFSDILTIPHAMGQSVSFEPGEGPRLSPFDVKYLSGIDFKVLEPIYQAIANTRNKLSKDKSLIGFSGTPWTLSAYMIYQQKIGDGVLLKKTVEHFPHMQELLDTLVICVTEHLIHQIKAGCDVVQLFDSWAGLCEPKDRQTYLLNPLRAILKGVWAVFPTTPVIYYGRHVSSLYRELSDIDGPLVFGVDQDTDICTIASLGRPVQGNLDPDVLIAGGEGLDRAIDSILDQSRNGAHIFNLGHGIKPETPINHVQQMIDRVRKSD